MLVVEREEGEEVELKSSELILLPSSSHSLCSLIRDQDIFKAGHMRRKCFSATRGETLVQCRDSRQDVRETTRREGGRKEGELGHRDSPPSSRTSSPSSQVYTDGYVFILLSGRTWSSLGQIRSLSRLSLPAPNVSFVFPSLSSLPSPSSPKAYSRLLHNPVSSSAQKSKLQIHLSLLQTRFLPRGWRVLHAFSTRSAPSRRQVRPPDHHLRPSSGSPVRSGTEESFP